MPDETGRTFCSTTSPDAEVAMIGENGTPVTPDWTPCVGNLCASCLGTANLCRCLLDVDEKPCCSGCTHAVEVEPLTWHGDQA